MDYQLKRAQEQDGRKYDPYEALNKAIKDERFQWLRGLSSIIAEIDELLSVRNRDKPLDAAPTLAKLVNLLDGENKEFVGYYSLALAADPRIAISEVDVRKSIARAKKISHPS